MMIVPVVVLAFIVFWPLAFIFSPLKELSFAIGMLFLFKWISGQWNCVYGYLECKLRQCPREKGIINNIVKSTYDAGLLLGPVFIGVVAFSTALSLL